MVGADWVRSNIASFFDVSFFTRGSSFGVARSLGLRERLRTGPLPRDNTIALAGAPLEGAGIATTLVSGALAGTFAGAAFTTSFATTFFAGAAFAAFTATGFLATTFFASTFLGATFLGATFFA